MAPDGLALRPALRSELPTLAAIQTAAHQADGLPHSGDAALLQHAVDHPRGLPPASILTVADLSGRPVGFVDIGRFVEPSGLHVYRHRGHVHPGWRHRGVGTALLEAAQHHLRQQREEVDQPAEWTYGSWHYEQEGGASELLIREGYVEHRRMIEMERQPRPPEGAAPLPVGEVRPVIAEDLPAIWRAYLTMSGDDESAVTHDQAQYQAWLALPFWDFKRWIVTWDREGVAGMVLPQVRDGEVYGIEFVGVRRGLRGEGVASTLLRTAVALKACRNVILQVSEGNRPAVALYQRCGFKMRRGLLVMRCN